MFKKKKLNVMILIIVSVVCITLSVFFFWSKCKIDKTVKVIEDIEFTCQDDSKIIYAEKLYDKLLAFQKKYVDNYDDLKLERRNYTRVNDLYNRIESIDKIDDDVNFTIEVNFAKNTYDALDYANRIKITNYQKLENYFCKVPNCENAVSNKSSSYCGTHSCIYFGCNEIKVHNMYWYYYCEKHICKYPNCNSMRTVGDYCIIHKWYNIH